MSYGVNRSKKKTTTRRKKRRASSGPARSVGKSKRRGTRTKSVRRARSTAKRPRKSSAKSRQRKSRPKKARLYTRYDPETGQKVRVTSDSYEYANWVSRKPSKKKQMRAALKADPLGTIGVVGLAAGTRAAEKLAERGVRAAVRKYGVQGAVVAGETAAALGYGTVALAALPVAAALGGILLAYASKPGSEENALSLQFVDAQRKLVQESGVKTWLEVPEAARTRLLNDYKAGLSRIAEVRRATSIVTANRMRK